MTKRQRAQVVELLRCAADNRSDGAGLNGMFWAAAELDTPVLLQNDAWDALASITFADSTPRTIVGHVDEGYRHDLLEAAQRVEEGSWT